MYQKDGRTISLEDAQLAAKRKGLNLEDWLEQTGFSPTDEGKTNGSTEMTPTEEPQPTPAGDSSSGDISLESQDLNPYLLTEKDLEGSEEEVYDKISAKLKAVGIETEEYIPGADAIKLTSNSGAFTSVAWATNKTAKDRQVNLNKFVKENADLLYADASIKGRENLLKDYSAATSVKISDKEAEKEYVKSKIAEWRKKETLDFGMGQRQTIELKEKDFEAPEEYKAYIEWKNTGVLEPNSVDVQNKKQLLIAKQKEARGEKFVRNLEDEDRNALESYTAKKVVDTKYRAENLGKEIEEINSSAEKLNTAVEAYNKDPKSADPVSLRKMVADWQGRVNSFESFVESLDTEETKDLSLALNNLSKEYSLIKKLGVGFKSQGINLAYGGAQILSGAGYIFDAAMTDATLEENIEKSVAGVQEAFQKPLQDVSKEQARLAKGTSFENALNSPGDLVNWSANAFVQAVPSLAMAFTGSAAMPLFFVSGYGGKAAEVANEEYAAAERMTENAALLESGEITDDQRVQIESQMAEDAKLLNIPAWKEMTASTIGGVAEVLFERLSTIRIIKGANAAINPLKPQIHKAVLKSAKDEGLSEGATQLVNNIADAALLDKDVNLFDGVGEAIAGGALVGSVLELRNAAPMVFDNVVYSLGTKSEIKDFKRDFEKLKELTGLDDITALLDPNVPTPAQSPEVEQLVNSVVEKINNRKTNIAERIGKDLTEEDLLEIGELNLKMKRINKRYAQIASTARPSELKAAEATLREEFDNLAEQRDAILMDGARGMDAIALNASRAIKMVAFEDMLFGVERARKDAQAAVNFSNLDEVSKNERLKTAKEKYGLSDKDAIEKKAIEDYKIEQNKEAIAEDEKRVQSFLEARGLGDKIKVRKVSDAEFKKLGLAQGNGEIDAVIVDGEIIVNEDAAARNNRVGVFSHEVLHALTSDVLGNGGGNQAGKDLLGWLEQNASDTYVYIKARLDALYEGNSAYYEEAMNALSDYIAEGNQVNVETVGKIQLFFNRIFKGSKAKELSLDNAAKTFAFIAQYADKNKTSKTEELIKSFQRALRSDDEKEASKKSLSAAAGRAQAALDKMQEEGYDPNNFELYDILNGMASAQLNKYKIKGLQITDMEEAVADVVGRLYTERDVNKFDGRGSLYGYLNGRIKFRILDAFKANPIWVEDFGDVDAEGLTGKEVQKVAVEAVETTEATQEAPKYRSLLDAKTVSPEGVKTATEKVMSTVRVMKKRLDESVSKNVTVKPYIAELKKDFGKQIDIILKKEMGTVKDRALQKWLLKNKKAILENMTTTWLMTAMPNAIQKKVDGQWTSDWKGKKIDRETVSTDNAGRTSGAEMVRRLPKASLKMSDADFLSNFFDEKGRLIRGRKESLAKAIGEEVGFEIFSQALQDETSPIRQAFEQRQDLLQTELAENFVAEVNRDIERGNVKFSKTNVETAIEGIDAYLRGDESNAEILFNKLPEALSNRIADFINNELIGIGLEGFKSPIKNAVYPDSVSEILGTYLGGVTNKKNKEAIDQMLDFTEKLLDNLPPELVAHLPKDVFGMHYRYADHNQFKRAKALNAKREAKALEAKSGTLPFNPAHIRILQGGTGLMSQIVNNVLNKDFNSKEAKIKAFQDLAGVTVSEASIANKAALQYILGKTFEIITKDPSKAVGVLRLFEGQTNMGQSLRGLTGLADIEFYAESQGAYYNAKTGKYYSTLNGDQKKKLGEEIVVNKNHPLYNDAAKYIADFNARSKKPSKLKPEDLLNFKGEHALPSAKMWFGVADIMLNRLAKAIDNPSTVEAERIAANIEIKELVDQFDQQLNSVLVSNIQDQVLGATSEVGDFRLGALSKPQQNAFHQTADGQQTAGRVRRKMSELLSLNKYVNAVEDIDPSAKFSKSTPRAVFMVGGPGAGKTNVGKGLKLGRRGYKVINQDIAVEALKEEADLPAREGEYTSEQRSLRSKIGAAARKAAQEKMEKYTNNRESMVVDGTGASFNATMKKIKVLEDAGYEVHLVFANTSLEEAVARNEARAERSLPQFVVEKSWEQVQESAAKYKEIYGERFYEVNTNELKIGEDLPKPLLDKLYKNLEVGPAKYSKTVNKEFNEILERKTGIGAEKVFSKVQAELRGAKKGRFKFFVAPGADDFRGLVHYAFAGKGKQGEADMAWFEEKLMDPYFKGIEAINRVRQQIKRDFKETIKTFRKEYKMLSKKIGDTGFTYDQALRVYMWNRQGTQVPGLSKRDTKLLLDAISKNPELVALADALLVVSRRTEWMEPGDYWQTQTVLSDLNGMTEKIGRKKYLAEFIENADIIFSEENLNKIEAIKGRAHREALEDALYAMRNGSNRPSGSNKQVNAFINWINGSTGAIMFFNRRSALLQMLSFTNFINWSDNNPAKAAAAFANQKQYWSDWAMIFNSDKLKERRSGLKTDVSEAELANAANRSKGDPRAILAYLLKIGFTPTQIADSMAIATGGATFYRNRINKYVKEGMSTKDAEAQAWIDFTKRSDEAQQSSDPALVSQLQRSVLGRLVFAFANTPMQYTRLMKKAAMDLAAGRGNFTENVSKIAYYGFVQNFIFSSLQSALFALIPGFDDEDEELDDKEAEKLAAKEEAKVARVLNSMIDTIVRGSGVYGAVGVTIKNTILEYLKQEEKGFLADHTYTVLSATSISPPINSKLRKIYSATQTKKFERDELEVRPWAVATEGRPNFGPGWSIVGNLVSGTLNVPLDRVVDELNSIGEAMDKRNTTWQRIALALGWKTWDVGAVDEEGDLIKAAGKAKRKEEGIEKAKKSRAATNAAKKAEEEKLSPLEKARKKRREAEAKRRKKRNK